MVLPNYMSPGVHYILTEIHKPLALLFVVFFVKQVSIHAGHALSVSESAGVSVALALIISTISNRLEKRRWEREAKAVGARLAPVAPGHWPLNIDLVWKQIKQLENGYPGENLIDFQTTYGPIFRIEPLGDTILFTMHPEHLQLMLASDFTNYEKGPRFQTAMRSVLGTGVFNSDPGDFWKFHRGMTRPFFSRDRITHFELFDRHAEEAIGRMKERLRAGYSVDFQDLISRFTLDTSTEFLFGRSVESMSAGLPYAYGVSPPAELIKEGTDEKSRVANEFARAFWTAQDRISRRERLGWVWPLLEIFGDKSKKDMKVIRGFIEPIIQEAVERQKASPPANEWEKQGRKPEDIEEDDTFLDHLVKLTEDPKVIRDEIFNIMIAGRDTTASTLTFTLYFLSKYPHVCERLRQEVMDKVGPNRRPTFEDIREMRYLRAVINETLRLFPVVPFNIRENIQPACWPSPDPSADPRPIYIPARTQLPYSVFMMHRREDLWGPDVLEFDPDRFLDERLKKYLAPRPFIFLPFNAGPRICLGQQFAYNEMSFMLIKLLQSFKSFTHFPDASPPSQRVPKEWKTTRGHGRMKVDDVWPKMVLTLYVGGGLWVKAEEAEEEAIV